MKISCGLGILLILTYCLERVSCQTVGDSCTDSLGRDGFYLPASDLFSNTNIGIGENTFVCATQCSTSLNGEFCVGGNGILEALNPDFGPKFWEIPWGNCFDALCGNIQCQSWSNLGDPCTLVDGRSGFCGIPTLAPYGTFSNTLNELNMLDYQGLMCVENCGPRTSLDQNPPQDVGCVNGNGLPGFCEPTYEGFTYENLPEGTMFNSFQCSTDGQGQRGCPGVDGGPCSFITIQEDDGGLGPEGRNNGCIVVKRPANTLCLTINGTQGYCNEFKCEENNGYQTKDAFGLPAYKALLGQNAGAIISSCMNLPNDTNLASLNQPPAPLPCQTIDSRGRTAVGTCNSLRSNADYVCEVSAFCETNRVGLCGRYGQNSVPKHCRPDFPFDPKFGIEQESFCVSSCATNYHCLFQDGQDLPLCLRTTGKCQQRPLDLTDGNTTQCVYDAGADTACSSRPCATWKCDVTCASPDPEGCCLVGPPAQAGTPCKLNTFDDGECNGNGYCVRDAKQCQADFECNDGFACTLDTCENNMCNNVAFQNNVCQMKNDIDAKCGTLVCNPNAVVKDADGCQVQPVEEHRGMSCTLSRGFTNFLASAPESGVCIDGFCIPQPAQPNPPPPTTVIPTPTLLPGIRVTPSPTPTPMPSVLPTGPTPTPTPSVLPTGPTPTPTSPTPTPTAIIPPLIPTVAPVPAPTTMPIFTTSSSSSSGDDDEEMEIFSLSDLPLDIENKWNFVDGFRHQRPVRGSPSDFRTDTSSASSAAEEGRSREADLPFLFSLRTFDSRVINEPWMFANAHQLRGVDVPDQRHVIPELVDDDEENDDEVYNSLRLLDGVFDCGVADLLNFDRTRLPDCGGSPDRFGLKLSGTFFSETDDDERVGCTPACYCRAITFNGQLWASPIACTKDYWPAGNTPDLLQSAIPCLIILSLVLALLSFVGMLYVAQTFFQYDIFGQRQGDVQNVIKNILQRLKQMQNKVLGEEEEGTAAEEEENIEDFANEEVVDFQPNAKFKL